MALSLTWYLVLALAAALVVLPPRAAAAQQGTLADPPVRSCGPTLLQIDRTLGRRGQWDSCTYEIVTLDTRALPKAYDPSKYWGLTAVINLAYAQRHNYSFRVVRPDIGRSRLPYNVNWLKPLYLAERVRELVQQGGCSWLMFMDSDAFFREFDVPLHAFLRRLASSYGIQSDVGAVFAQEEPMPSVHLFQKYGVHWANAGVFMLQANLHAQNLLSAWIESGRQDQQARHTWPAEQGTLTELLFPGRFPRAHVVSHFNRSGSAVAVNMTEFNSPWGKFVEHAWSGVGRKKRYEDPASMLVSLGLGGGGPEAPGGFDRLLEDARGHVVPWRPPADF